MLTFCFAFLISSYIYSSNLYVILLIFMQVSCHFNKAEKELILQRVLFMVANKAGDMGTDI